MIGYIKYCSLAGGIYGINNKYDYTKIPYIRRTESGNNPDLPCIQLPNSIKGALCGVFVGPFVPIIIPFGILLFAGCESINYFYYGDISGAHDNKCKR